MDKIELLKKVLFKFHPEVNFIVRFTKKGFYNIIIKGVRGIEYDEVLMERVFVFIHANPIQIAWPTKQTQPLPLAMVASHAALWC